MSRDDAEAAAAIDIHVREIEREHVQGAAIDHDVFAVITNQVVGCPGDDDSGGEAAQFQLAQAAFAAPVRTCDQDGYAHAPVSCLFQCHLHVFSIEAEDGDLYALLSALDGGKQRRHTVDWLDDQF